MIGCPDFRDNIFYGSSMAKVLQEAKILWRVDGYRVSDPERYGVVEFDGNMKALSIEEKLQRRRAITQSQDCTTTIEWWRSRRI